MHQMCVDRARAERGTVRWIGTGGEVMLDQLADVAIGEPGHVGGAGGSGNR